MKICPVCSTKYADDVRFCPNDGQTLRASGPAADQVGQVIADRYPPRERARPAVDAANARLLLDKVVDTLEPRTARLVLDSAHAIFTAPGLASKDKAYAAFVVANAFFQANDRAKGCGWVRTATALDSLRGSYRKLLDQCQR